MSYLDGSNSCSHCPRKETLSVLITTEKELTLYLQCRASIWFMLGIQYFVTVRELRYEEVKLIKLTLGKLSLNFFFALFIGICCPSNCHFSRLSYKHSVTLTYFLSFLPSLPPSFLSFLPSFFVTFSYMLT